MAPRLFPVLLLLGCCLTLPDPRWARADDPKADRTQQEVDKEEILRRGDLVEHITPGEVGIDLDNPTATPPDDNHKWHVTLYLAKGQPESEALLRDWRNHPKLAAWGNIDDPARSWSHMHVMYQGDKMNNWRWGSIDPTRTPVIWVQPPRGGAWGDAGTIVAQYPYAGDPDAAAAHLSRSLNLYGKVIGDARRERYRAAEAAAGRVADEAIDRFCQSHEAGQCPFCPTPGPGPAVDPNQPYQPLPYPSPVGPGPAMYPPESAFGGGLAELFAPVLTALKNLIPVVVYLLFGGGVAFGGYKAYKGLQAGQVANQAAVRVQAAEPLVMQTAELRSFEDPQRDETNRLLAELALAVQALAEKK